MGTGISVAERLRFLFRWAFPPRDGQGPEEHLLDAMEFAILTVASDIKAMAKWQAPKLARNPEAWSFWVKGSSLEPMAWYTVQLAAREVWEEAPDVLLRSPLGVWAVEAGIGIRSKPSVSGPNPFELLWRDAAIVVTVKGIVALGERPPTSTTYGRSACHAVAERFESRPDGHYGVRVPKSYDGVRRIWQKRHRDEEARRKDTSLDP